MKILHAKSPCCRGSINHFGKRRRQCSICKRTWRIRQKRRGRKQKRIDRQLTHRILIEHRTFQHHCRKGAVSQSGFSRRLSKAIRSDLKLKARLRFPSSPYALLGDGLYFKFKRMDWVLYVMAVKPVKSNRAFFLDPVLLQGKECYERWRVALATIPPKTKKRVKAFVSDGFRGSKLIAREHGWIHQRCHFHLLLALIRRHGRRLYRVKGAGIREKLLGVVRALLTTPDSAILRRRTLKARRLISHPLCPPWIRIQTVEFLRTLDDFRAYLIHPELNLPTTNNSIESSGRIIRKATSTARTPQAVLLRATAFLRIKKSITCNGKSSTKLCQWTQNFLFNYRSTRCFYYSGRDSWQHCHLCLLR